MEMKPDIKNTKLKTLMHIQRGLDRVMEERPEGDRGGSRENSSEGVRS